MKIALIGYGKMGHEIEKIALSRGHEVVCKIDIDNPQDFDSPEFRNADVAIEFTAPTQAYGNIQKCFKAGVKVVSGSTGWMEQHRDEMKDLCKDGANTLFWSSNFSIGVALFSKVNSYLAKLMNGYPMYEVSMSETHHIHKLDAPSGTAITLAEGIISELDRKSGWSKGILLNPDGSVTGIPEGNAAHQHLLCDGAGGEHDTDSRSFPGGRRQPVRVCLRHDRYVVLRGSAGLPGCGGTEAAAAGGLFPDVYG
jgi:4-hydroxy-tetrahydrodipicolinate reductase